MPGRLERVSGFEFLVSSCGKASPSASPNEKPETRNQKLPLPTVLVDYAHTHDALENVLRTLRPVTSGRLIVLFGCGGDRDRSKRPKMAAVACRLADRVYITSDNPRTEDPQRIIDDILQGVADGEWRMANGGCEESALPHIPHPPSDIPHLVVLPDRAEAIRACIRAAEPADTVLLAGKGHEDYQIVGTQKFHFDDREQAALALEQWKQERLASCRPSP